jgi:hypothetical protein
LRRERTPIGRPAYSSPDSYIHGHAAPDLLNFSIEIASG